MRPAADQGQARLRLRRFGYTKPVDVNTVLILCAGMPVHVTPAQAGRNYTGFFRRMANRRVFP